MKTKIQPLSKLIKSHKFNWVNKKITNDLFERPKELRTEFKLFNFDRNISSEDIIKEMKKGGYSPANAWELLTWKEWNNTDTVVALGSVGKVDGNRNVPYLNRNDSERYLSLCWWDGDWGARCRFLGVRYSDSQTLEKSALRSSETLTLESAIKMVKENGYKIIKEF